MPARAQKRTIRPSILLLSTIVLALTLSPQALTYAAAAPVNDAFVNAIPLFGSRIVANASNAGATKQPGEPSHAGDAGGKSVWWSWTAPFTGSIVMHTAGSTFDTLLAIYTGDTVTALTLVAANDQDLTDPLGGDTSRVKFNASADTVYHIAVDGFSGAFGSIVLTIEPPPRPANDNFAAATQLSGSIVQTNGTNRDATREAGEPQFADGAGGKSVWWNWTAPASAQTTIATLGSDFDTLLYVCVGDAVDDLTLVAANDQDPLGGDTSRVTFEARSGVAYHIGVDGWNGESGTIILNLEVRPPPPTLSAPRLLAGSWQFTLSGEPGGIYALEVATNLNSPSWSAIATNVAGSTGLCLFNEPNTAGRFQRFYRARLKD